jgi:hypothetical protein
MPAKKAPKKAVKKPSSVLSLSDKERAALRKGGEADMKKHGFKSPEEYIKWIDNQRGY